MKNYNKKLLYGSRDEALAQGYSPCGNVRLKILVYYHKCALNCKKCQSAFCAFCAFCASFCGFVRKSEHFVRKHLYLLTFNELCSIIRI